MPLDGANQQPQINRHSQIPAYQSNKAETPKLNSRDKTIIGFVKRLFHRMTGKVHADTTVKFVAVKFVAKKPKKEESEPTLEKLSFWEKIANKIFEGNDL